MVIAFFAALALIWWKPVPPEVETPPATDIDLTSSRGAKVWGVAVVAAVALLYYFFF